MAQRKLVAGAGEDVLRRQPHGAALVRQQPGIEPGVDLVLVHQDAAGKPYQREPRPEPQAQPAVKAAPFGGSGS